MLNVIKIETTRLYFRELLAGDSDFRKEQRAQQKELADESSGDEDAEGGKMVALTLGERDEFTKDTI